MKPSERISEIAGVSRLETSGLLAAVVAYLDEAEERRHPIARVHQHANLQVGALRCNQCGLPAHHNGGNCPLDYNGSVVVVPAHPAPDLCRHEPGRCKEWCPVGAKGELESPPGGEEAEPTRTQEAIASRYAAGETIRELADDYNLREDVLLRAVRNTLGYLLIEHPKLTEERDTLRARVEELEEETKRRVEAVAQQVADSWQARAMQLEGELATLGSACDKMRVQNAETCRGLDDEASRLRAEVNRLNAEAFELKRDLAEAMRMGEQLADSSAVLIANRDAVVEAVAEMDKVYRAPDTDADDVIAVYQSRVMPAMRALAALDQPNEPKT